MTFKVMIMTPSSGVCRIQFAASLANMMMHFRNIPVYNESSIQNISFRYVEGTGVSQNREQMVRSLLESDYTHLCFIDDDMGFNPDTLNVLAGRRLPIVGCNYRVRRPPALFMACRDGKEVETHAEKWGLEAVDFMGLGFCLIHRDVFEAVPEPRFMIEWRPGNPGLGYYTTEDSQFFRRCREAGFEAIVDHDASKRIWHNGNIAYIWNDDFSKINKAFV